MKLEGYACEHPTVAGKPCLICQVHYSPAVRARDIGEWDADRIPRIPWDEVSAIATVQFVSPHSLKSRLAAIRAMIGMTPKNRMVQDAMAMAAARGGPLY